MVPNLLRSSYLILDFMNYTKILPMHVLLFLDYLWLDILDEWVSSHGSLGLYCYLLLFGGYIH